MASSPTAEALQTAVKGSFQDAADEVIEVPVRQPDSSLNRLNGRGSSKLRERNLRKSNGWKRLLKLNYGHRS